MHLASQFLTVIKNQKKNDGRWSSEQCCCVPIVVCGPGWYFDDDTFIPGEDTGCLPCPPGSYKSEHSTGWFDSDTSESAAKNALQFLNFCQKLTRWCMFPTVDVFQQPALPVLLGTQLLQKQPSVRSSVCSSADTTMEWGQICLLDFLHSSSEDECPCTHFFSCRTWLQMKHLLNLGPVRCTGNVRNNLPFK